MINNVFILIFVLVLRKIGKYGGVDCYSKSITQFQVPAKPKACYFTGAGVFFFWQVGAAKYMQETCYLKNIPILGASAGALSGLLMLAKVDLDKATEVALTQSVESGVYSKQTGLAGELGGLLYAWLNKIVPEDLKMEDLENLHIAITPASVKSPKLVSRFKDRADVISACMASCHVPVFLDGRATTSYRGEAVIDGSFWYFVTKNRNNGLPLLPNCAPEDVLWIDYTDDDEFMSQIDGNFLGIVSEDGIYDMIRAGYNHMKREHFYGRLPIARVQRPSYVLSSVLKGIRETTVPASVGEIYNFYNALPLKRIKARPLQPPQAAEDGGPVIAAAPTRPAWRTELPTFAAESVKWFLAAGGATAGLVDSLGNALVNIFIFSLALQSMQEVAHFS